jgi:hypothetical protein
MFRKQHGINNTGFVGLKVCAIGWYSLLFLYETPLIFEGTGIFMGIKGS